MEHTYTVNGSFTQLYAVTIVREYKYLDRHSGSVSTLELLSMVASSVGICHRYSGPNTGRNSGEGQRKKNTLKWQCTFSVLLQVGGGRLYRVPPIRAFFHTVTGARYAMLFNNGGLKNNEITFFPNHDTFHCSQLLPLCRCCRRAEDETDLPEAIVESAKNVIISQKKDLDGDQVLKYIDRVPHFINI